jgi:hypothetical protein
MPKRSRRTNRQQQIIRNPIPNAVGLSFPSVVRSALSRQAGQQNDAVVRRLSSSGTITSTAATLVTTIINLNPSSFNDWSNFVNLYDEFRILGVRLRLFCSQQNSLTAASPVCVMVFDNDDTSSVLTGILNALDYRVQTQFAAVWDNQSFPTITAYRTLTAANGNWLTTASPSLLPCSVKFYGAGLTASTAYWSYTVELVCEFRGST